MWHIFRQMFAECGKTPDRLEIGTAERHRGAESEGDDPRHRGEDQVGNEIGVHGQQFELLEPARRIHRAIGRRDAANTFICKRGDDRAQIIGPEPDVAVADDEQIVARMGIGDFEIFGSSRWSAVRFRRSPASPGRVRIPRAPSASRELPDRRAAAPRGRPGNRDNPAGTPAADWSADPCRRRRAA